MSNHEFKPDCPCFPEGFGVAAERVQPIAEATEEAVVGWMKDEYGGMAQNVMIRIADRIPDFHPESAWAGYSLSQEFKTATCERRAPHYYVEESPQMAFNHGEGHWAKTLVPDVDRFREIVDTVDAIVLNRPAWRTTAQDLQELFGWLSPMTPRESVFATGQYFTRLMMPLVEQFPTRYGEKEFIKNYYYDPEDPDHDFEEIPWQDRQPDYDPEIPF